MSRIILTLSAVGLSLLGISIFLGLGIDDPRSRDIAVQAGVSRHMLVGLGSLIFAALVHAITFTYFMGTGRWIEETSQAYRLSPDFFVENQSVKYRLLPGITGCIIMLTMTGAFGGAADPASAVNFQGWLGITPATIHLLVVLATVTLQFAVNVHEFRSIERNGEIIERVMAEVRRIRIDRGLPVDPPEARQPQPDHT